MAPIRMAMPDANASHWGTSIALLRRPIVIGVLLLAAGCKDEPPRPDREPPAPTGLAGDRPRASDSAAQPGSTAPTSSTPPASADAAAFAGTWEGAYDAKKGAVVLPKDVKNTSQTKDDGKTAIGAGRITLTIGPAGDVAGSAKGALGDAKLTGKAEGNVVRASVFPDDPTVPHSMTGVFVGMLKDGAIRGDLRVAGPDATMVRESTVELKKK